MSGHRGSRSPRPIRLVAARPRALHSQAALYVEVALDGAGGDRPPTLPARRRNSKLCEGSRRQSVAENFLPGEATMSARAVIETVPESSPVTSPLRGAHFQDSLAS